MHQPIKIPLNEIRRKVGPADVFICSASFETRCLSLPEELQHAGFERVLVCANENFPHVVRTAGKHLQTLFGTTSRLVPLNTDDPLKTADSLQAAIDETLAAKRVRFLVDITTFTHESLLILLRILQLRSISSVDCLYTTAKEYSVGDTDDRKWLSKGIGEVRSVLGYSGNALPSNKLHLIVMAGFEAERAERLMQEYEPSRVSIGLGDPNYSISPDHYKANRIFHGKLLEKYTNVLEFTFSCSDPEETRIALRKQVRLVPDHNVLISPMNTKISTIGAALLAFEDEAIQLCYATAHQYNERRYSTPGDHCYYFPAMLDSTAGDRAKFSS